MKAAAEYIQAKPGVVVGVIMQVCGLLFDDSNLSTCGLMVMAVFLAASWSKRGEEE